MYGRADQPADAPGSPPRVTEPPPLRPPSEAVRRSSPSRLRPGHAARTDADLLRLAREGDPLAYEAIVARYREPLRRACARIVPERAEDAVQQALISAWLALERGAEVRELRPWLYSIARNAAIDQARGIRAELVELGPEVAGGEDPAHAEARRREVTDVLEAVAALPERQRRALVATALHGRATEAVAVDLGLSGGALRQLVHRARTNVRAAVPSLGFPIPAWLAELVGEEGARRGVVILSSGSGAALLAKTTATVATVGAVIAGGVQLDPPRAGASSSAAGVQVASVATPSEDQVTAARSALVSPGALVPAATAPTLTTQTPQPTAPSRGGPAAASTEASESPTERRGTHEPPTLGLNAAPAGEHDEARRRSGRTDRDRTWRAPVGGDDGVRDARDVGDDPASGAGSTDQQRGGGRGSGGGHQRPPKGGADHSDAVSSSPSRETSADEHTTPTTATTTLESEPTSPAPSSSTPTDAPTDAPDRDNSSAGSSSE